MLTTSRTLVIGFYSSEMMGEEAVLTVCKRMPRGLELVKVIHGDEARELYEKLTNTNLERGNKNE
jgi:hypothetical protein